MINGAAQPTAGDRNPRRGWASHLRRYGAFYAIGAAVLLILVLVPVVTGDDDPEEGNTVAASEGNGDGPWRPASGDIEHGTGTTRGGEACEEGVLQLPDTVYAPPCLPEFTGDNGGATSRGVTRDTIKLVFRTFPDSADAQAFRRAANPGGAAPSTVDPADVSDRFLEYLNGSYELYGRRIEIEEYVSQFGNASAEGLGGGREGACQDATQIAEEIGAFGVMSAGGVFSECAAERGLMVFDSAAFYGGPPFSEQWYDEQHPYVWASNDMDCDRRAAHVAEYVGKRLLGRPAKFAGDPELAGRQRTFGTYVAENEQFVHCADVTQSILREEYGDDGSGVVVRYQLDISRLAEQAVRAIVQFKAEDVTTVVTDADPVSVAALTTAATEQDYHPEWLVTGFRANLNPFARTYDQDQADGHLFGLSSATETRNVFGPEADIPRLYQKLTGEEWHPGDPQGNFYLLVNVMNLFQAAGPDLTPENVARGAWTLPPMGDQDSAVGRWWYGESVDGEGGDHTPVEDLTEVYWDADAPPEEFEVIPGASGDFIPTYGGRRFDLGEWPEEEPELGGT